MHRHHFLHIFTLHCENISSSSWHNNDVDNESTPTYEIMQYRCVFLAVVCQKTAKVARSRFRDRVKVRASRFVLVGLGLRLEFRHFSKFLAQATSIVRCK